MKKEKISSRYRWHCMKWKVNKEKIRVISLAEVVETYKKSDFKENEKHSEVRWISREEVDTFKEDTVKDFKNTLKLAFAKMEEMYGNTDE